MFVWDVAVSLAVIGSVSTGRRVAVTLTLAPLRFFVHVTTKSLGAVGGGGELGLDVIADPNRVVAGGAAVGERQAERVGRGVGPVVDDRDLEGDGPGVRAPGTLHRHAEVGARPGRRRPAVLAVGDAARARSLVAGVGARTAVDGVVAILAEDRVVALATPKAVIADGTGDVVIAAAARDAVATTGREDVIVPAARTDAIAPASGP